MLGTLCLARAVECEAVLVMCNVAGPKLDEQKIEEVRETLRRQSEDEGKGEEELETPLIGLGRSCVCAPF